MHKRKRFLSLGLSLMLAVGSMTVPTLAAEDFYRWDRCSRI